MFILPLIWFDYSDDMSLVIRSREDVNAFQFFLLHGRGSSLMLRANDVYKKARCTLNNANTRDDGDTNGDMASKGNPTTRGKANRDISLFSVPSTDGSPWGTALDRYIRSRL